MTAKRISSRALQALVLGLFLSVPGWAAPIPVRYPEGTTHGYLALVDSSGTRVAHGELLQRVTGVQVRSRLIFYFTDGSLHDEQAVFTQDRVFTLQRYELTQQGPSFPRPVDILLERQPGRYRVRAPDGKELAAGRLDLPPDVYNGMLIMLLKNLGPDSKELVHLVVFTPTPRVVPIRLSPIRTATVTVGTASKQATLYELQPRLGRMLRFFGELFGLLPEKYHYFCWILHDGVPAFVQFEGPLFLKGPIWRIQLLSPRIAPP